MSAEVKTLYIIDPALTERRGHMYNIAVGLAEVARRAGIRCVVFANRSFQCGPGEDSFLVPHFTETTLATGTATSAAWKYLNLNRLFFGELKALSKAYDFTDSIVVFPTANQNLIDAIQRWNLLLPAEGNTTLIVSLMLQAGILFQSESDFIVTDQEMANLYRAALAGFARPGQENCVLCSNTEPLIRAYRALYGRPIRFHPTLCGTPDPQHLLEGRAARQAAQRPRVVLNLGELKPDKGFHLVPEILVQSLERGIQADFVIHITGTEYMLLERYWDEITLLRRIQASDLAVTSGQGFVHRERFPDYAALLARIPPSDSRIELIDGFLSPDEYYRTLSGASAIVLPYSLEQYRDMSSGVLTEALYCEVPVVVPSGSWLALEAQTYGTGHQTFDGVDPTAATDALERLLADLPGHAARCAEAGERYRDANGFQRFLDIAIQWHNEPRPQPPTIGHAGGMAGRPIFA